MELWSTSPLHPYIALQLFPGVSLRNQRWLTQTLIVLTGSATMLCLRRVVSICHHEQPPSWKEENGAENRSLMNTYPGQQAFAHRCWNQVFTREVAFMRGGRDNRQTTTMVSPELRV